MHLVPLPYHHDSADLFERIADAPWAMFLDSGRPHGGSGRWDLLAADPRATLVTHGRSTRIEAAGTVRLSDDDPLSLLRAQLGPRVQPTPDLPFVGGAIGYLGYDLGRRLTGLTGSTAGEAAEMAMGIYDWAVMVDHARQASWLVLDPAAAKDTTAVAALAARFSAPTTARRRQPFTATGPVSVSLGGAAYAHAFARVQEYIRAGDCYQTNLALRFSVAVTGDPWDAYRRLRQLNPAPFAAYLNLPGARVLSSSPERFLELRQTQVTTRPIKGTRPRAADPADDRRRIRELASSAKDRAENLMIVDLLRNDLGKVCRPGSIAVPDLFAVESFANVHHLVSTVTGELRAGMDALDLLRACLPGGSITGAPKRRAMQIIDELEPHRRGVYCGAIGYLSRCGDMDTNIAIRTMWVGKAEAEFWAGGGLVADSTLAGEYQECLDKAAPMLRLLQGEAAGVAPRLG